MRVTTFVTCLVMAGCSGRPAALVDARGDGASDAACPEGLTQCDGECVDTKTSLAHCGACDWVCDEARSGGGVPICEAGQCIHGDPCLHEICDGACVALMSDNENCGECGIQCDVENGFACSAGECRCAGRALTVCSGMCVDLQTDEQHCGECGAVCDRFVWPGYRTVSCEAGECKHGTEKDCGGAWADLQSDDAHCGECDHACDTGSGFTCIGGTCACAGDFVACDGVCVSLKTTAHCGDCHTACARCQTCQDPGNGFFACTDLSCPSTMMICFPDCVCAEPMTSTEHCGECNNPCAGGMHCNAGQCECPPPLPDDCGGTCVDQQTDPANCGDCGITCASGVCSGGQCEGDAGVIYPDASPDAGMDLHVPD